MTQELTIPKAIENETADLVVQANSFEITDKLSLDQGSIITSNIRKMAKIIKERKEEITKPMNTALKSARALFKPLEEQLETAETVLKYKIGGFQAKLQDDALKQRQELLKGADPFDESLTEKLAEIDLRQELAGGLYTRSDKEIVIIDENLVPDKYWEINMVLLRKDALALKSTQKMIAGVEVRIKKNIVIRQ